MLGPLVTVAVIWLARRDEPGRALALAACAAGAVALADVVKLVVDRGRPATVHLVAVSSGSFPSQHAVQAAGVLPALALIVRGKRARAAAVAAAVALVAAVGFSRVYLGAHFPTDVIAGWALGGAWCAASARAAR